MAQFIDISWTDIKARATSKVLEIQYKEQADYYLVWLQENVNVYRAKILITPTRNTDQIDFEDNYQSSSNAIHGDKVEIYDHSSGLTADVVLDNGIHKLAVITDAVSSGSSNNIFGQASIASAATTNVVSYTVPTAKEYIINNIIVGGAEYGLFELKIDGSVVVRIRNSGSEPTQELTTINEIATAAQVITIAATNQGNKTRTFEGTLFGTERDV